MQSQKWQNHLSSFPRQTIQYHSDPNPCPNSWCQRSWSWLVVWRPTTSSRTNTEEKKINKGVLFVIGYWNAKAESQEIPGVSGKFALGLQNQSGERLTVLWGEHAGYSKHPFPTTQEMTLHMDITKCSTPKSDWLYSFQLKIEKLSTVNKNKTWSWLWLRLWTPYCKILA